MTALAATAYYLPVFQMAVRHQYTGAAPYTAFTMAPLGETEKTMARFGLRAGQTGNSFAIYAEAAGLPALGKAPLRNWFSSLELVFAIGFTDPSFGHFTDWPMRAEAVPVFFGRAAGRRLTAGPMVSEQDLLPVRSGSFRYPLPARPGPGPAQLVALGGWPIAKLPSPIQGQVQVDVSQVPAGCYGLELAGKTIFSFFCAGRISLLPISAILRIPCAAMLTTPSPASGKMGRPEASERNVAQLTFGARATAWRYDILNHGGAEAARFSIAEVPPAAARRGRNPNPAQRRFFTPVQGIPGPGGETSIAFESPLARPIPLQATPAHQFQLLRDGQVIIEHLPTPDLHFRRASDGKTLLSDMFVYL